MPMVAGTFTVITGYPGAGKTSMLMVILANLMKAGVAMAIGSFETLPKQSDWDRSRAH